MLYSCEGGVLGSGAYVDGGEVLPVVEDVGADLFCSFLGGCAFQKNFIHRHRSPMDRAPSRIRSVRPIDMGAR